MAKMINEVQCPLKNKKIDICKCFEIQDVVNNFIEDDILDFHLTDKEKEICQHCPKQTDITK